MSSQTPLGQNQQIGSPTASSSGSNPVTGSPAQGSNRSPTPGGTAGGSTAAAAAAAAAAAQKQVLTDEQKKANHIASEKKRRNNIREQYDKLAEMIPGMAGQGRSEGRVLEEAVKMATQLVQEREAMITQIKTNGGTVDPKLYEEIDKAAKVIRENSPRLHSGGRSDSQGTTAPQPQPHYKHRRLLPRTNIYLKQVNQTSNVTDAASEDMTHEATNVAPSPVEPYPTPPGTRSSDISFGVDPRVSMNASLEPMRPYTTAIPYDQRADLVSMQNGGNQQYAHCSPDFYPRDYQDSNVYHPNYWSTPVPMYVTPPAQGYATYLSVDTALPKGDRHTISKADRERREQSRGEDEGRDEKESGGGDEGGGGGHGDRVNEEKRKRAKRSHEINEQRR